MTTIRFKLPKIEQVTFTVECFPEDMAIEGNCSAIDEETDKANENYILEELNNGNEWAWCTIKVTANYKNLEGSDYLGGCSYKSKSEFIKEPGYYEDMKQAAFDDLIESLKSLKD